MRSRRKIGLKIRASRLGLSFLMTGLQTFDHFVIQDTFRLQV
jgi:hypothetical protein